jgi:pSer/pThr/pTyr-binding forkhead associated (FHA) protein
MAKLVLSSEGSVRFQCFLDKERVGVGRDPANQVVIDDPFVGPRHAAIFAVGNDHILEDLQTGAGTFVNGNRISRHILQHGDVMQFGAFFLRYLNPRATAEKDFERTMLISGLRKDDDAQRFESEAARDARGASARPSANRFPVGKVRVIAGNGAGDTIALDRVVTTFGKPEGDLAVIARRPHGFFLSHVSGRGDTRVNGETVGGETRGLRHGDVVEVDEHRLEFLLD